MDSASLMCTDLTAHQLIKLLDNSKKLKINLYGISCFEWKLVPAQLSEMYEYKSNSIKYNIQNMSSIEDEELGHPWLSWHYID